MKYYIISGEASGDLHASNLIRALKQNDPEAEVRGWGGELMQDAGATIAKHYRDLAFMGFVEVVQNLPTILRNFDFCRRDILSYQPDVVILIDYPGFNLRMAKFIKQQGFKVYYYICPQVWAWHASRAKQLKAYTDKMFVILPFEQSYYADKWQMKTYFYGHPLLDAIENSRKEWANVSPTALGLPNDGKPIIAILPGSRKQEVRRLLPIMLAASRHFPQYRFVVAAVHSLPAELYDEFLQPYPDVYRLIGNTHALLYLAEAGIIKSGTSTLEAALLGCPQVVCYKAGAVSYAIAKRVANVSYISLVNLILNRPAVVELLQNDCHDDNIATGLANIVEGGKARQKVLEDYAQLRRMLGEGGASAQVARAMVDGLRGE